MKDNRQAGKGSKPRPVKGDVYRDNWEEIFRKKKPEEKPTQTPQPTEGSTPSA